MGVLINKQDTVQELVMMTTQLTNTKQNVEILIKRFEEYLNDEENNSEAISSHKTYIQTAQLPVAKGIIDICDRKAEANGKYIERLHSLFPSDNDIDQDYWVEMYNSLCEQYNEINNLHTMAVQFLKSLIFKAYEPKTSYGKDYEVGMTDTSPQKVPEGYENTYELYQCNIDSYAHELAVLSRAMSYYSIKISYVEILLRDLYGLYYYADVLNDALAKAIQQLENIGVTRNGNYYYHNVDCSAFENLESTIDKLNAGDLIREELGEDYIPPTKMKDMPEKDRLEYLDKVNEVAKAVLPSMSFKRGYEEIPLGLGFTVYYENTVTLKNDSDFPISNSLTEKNNNYLSSSSLSLGDCSISGTDESGNVKYSKKLDQNTSVYLKAGVNLSNNTYYLETGVTTTVGEVKNDTHAYYAEKATVTTACGVKYEPNSGGWTPDGSSVSLLSANALPIVSVSDWELATQIIGIPAGLPGGILAPAY
ncbi:MAG: hypothetical protein E7257_04910 [Lachnospiraceae bacterium]|nr:hypothetical protein [Lachnospiraceae bacterium]